MEPRGDHVAIALTRYGRGLYTLTADASSDAIQPDRDLTGSDLPRALKSPVSSSAYGLGLFLVAVAR